MNGVGCIRRNRIGGAAFLSICIGVTLVIFHRGNGLRAEDSPQGKNQPRVGGLAPAFNVQKLGGGEVSLADYRGKIVMVNFWATWCGGCRLEMLWLAELRQKYASQGFEVLGIVTDDAPPEKIAEITHRYGVKYPILICNHRTANAYGGLPYLPASFFISRKGTVIEEMAAAASKEEIETDIRKLLVVGDRR